MSWSAVLLYEGEPVTGPVPCDDYDAAGIFGPLVVAWLGGPVSIGAAVVASRPPVVDPQQSLFEDEGVTA